MTNLWYVNQSLYEQYEGLDLFLILFSQGEYFITFDLKSGYHYARSHGSILNLHRVMELMANSTCLQSCHLGLPWYYVVTELLRLLVKRWRGMDLKANVYIDDGICSAKSQLELQPLAWFPY